MPANANHFAYTRVKPPFCCGGDRWTSHMNPADDPRTKISTSRK